jgi:uncharacterized protein (DUF1501 family)
MTMMERPMTNPTTDECGCPTPTGLSRRGVLGRALAAGAAGALASLTGADLSTRLAFAATPYTGDTLVVLSLRGGFDGLSAVVPAGDPDYYKARPTIGVPKDKLLAGDDLFGLHPALAPLQKLWTAGNLAAVHAVGQPNPTRSHFKAMAQLEQAAPGTSLRTGWLDRTLGLIGATGPFSGVSVGTATPAGALAGPGPNLSLASIDGFTLSGDGGGNAMGQAMRDLYATVPSSLADSARAVNTALAAAAPTVAESYVPANGAAYPNSTLGKALRDVARLIKSNLSLVTACVDCGDWDMHQGLGTAVKGQQMYDKLTDLAQSLLAFTTDLGTAGMAKVTVLTVSEFGRRVQENGSVGTDHGNGNAMLLLGGGVRGGRVYGTWPGLAPNHLVAGDLAATTDYRSVIGEVLQKRCGLGNLDSVFPGAKPSTFGLVNAQTSAAKAPSKASAQPATKAPAKTPAKVAASPTKAPAGATVKVPVRSTAKR